MTETKPGSRRQIGDAILLLWATGGLVQLLALSVRPDSFARQFIEAGLQRIQLSPIVMSRRMDRYILEAARQSNGNLAAELPGLNLGDTPNPELAKDFYFRAVYTLWPRRIFVAAPGTVINSAEELANAPPAANPRWLQAHDVHQIVHFGFNDQQMTIERRGIPATLSESGPSR